MKTFFKYGFILFFVVAISCGILAWVNAQTAPLIEENMRLAKINAQKSVFPEAYSFTEIENEDFVYSIAYDVHNNLIGYILEASGQGYSGVIKTIVGLSADFTINRIAILEQSETPGLGANCTRADFLHRFKDLSLRDLKIDKDGGNITSITGATLTTRTITNSIRNILERLQIEQEQSSLHSGGDK